MKKGSNVISIVETYTLIKGSYYKVHDNDGDYLYVSWLTSHDVIKESKNNFKKAPILKKGYKIFTDRPNGWLIRYKTYEIVEVTDTHISAFNVDNPSKIIKDIPFHVFKVLTNDAE